MHLNTVDDYLYNYESINTASYFLKMIKSLENGKFLFDLLAGTFSDKTFYLEKIFSKTPEYLGKSVYAEYYINFENGTIYINSSLNGKYSESELLDVIWFCDKNKISIDDKFLKRIRKIANLKKYECKED